MKNIYTLLTVLMLAFSLQAQKPVKIMSNAVFDGMDAKTQEDIDGNFDKARSSFEKVLIKDSTDAMANFGLSVVLSYDKYTGKDYFGAWKHFKMADSNLSLFTDEDKEIMNEYFFRQDKKRRGRPFDKNMEIERDLVEDKLIKFVREENNLQYAKKFLVEFPHSKYFTNVTHIRNYIEFRTAENTNTVEAFNNFLQTYSDAAQVQTATELRNKIAYTDAKAKNSLSALRDFVKKYPKAVEVEDAKKLMGVLAFSEAEKVRTLDAINAFMNEFPNSSKMPDAKLLKRQLLFEWAKKVNTIDAYNQFVALYPEGELYIDIFNLKAAALGQKVVMDFPVENYLFIKGFDNQNISEYGGSLAYQGDGQLIVVTNTKPDINSLYDSWLLELDKSGKMIWNKILGNEFDDQVNKILINDKNELYAAGITNAIVDSIKGQAWIYKLSADKKNIYNRKLEGSEVLGLAVYPDGKALVAGYKDESDTASVSFLVKVNEKGKKLWSRSYSSSNKLFDMKMGDENIAFIAAGNYILAVDENGYVKWDAYMTEGQFITSVGLTNGQQPVFAGKKGTDGYAIAFDKDGHKLWENTFESGESGQEQSVIGLSDQSILIGGSFDNSIKITQLDNKGNLLKTRKFSVPEGIRLNDMVPSEGNSATISATRLSQNKDLIVFKLTF